MSATANTEAKSFDLKGFISKFAIVFILALFVVVLAIITSGRFLNYKNLINVIVQVAPIGIIALGMMFAIITKGIDLSVGSTVALVAVVSASLAQVQSDTAMFPGLPPMPIFVSIIVGLLVGAIVGAIVYFLFKDLLGEWATHSMAIFGAALIAVIVFSPNGIVGALAMLRRRLRYGPQKKKGTHP